MVAFLVTDTFFPDILQPKSVLTMKSKTGQYRQNFAATWKLSSLNIALSLCKFSSRTEADKVIKGVIAYQAAPLLHKQQEHCPD